jgi:hypothetical protein
LLGAEELFLADAVPDFKGDGEGEDGSGIDQNGIEPAGVFPTAVEGVEEPVVG